MFYYFWKVVCWLMLCEIQVVYVILFSIFRVKTCFSFNTTLQDAKYAFTVNCYFITRHINIIIIYTYT